MAIHYEPEPEPDTILFRRRVRHGIVLALLALVCVLLGRVLVW